MQKPINDLILEAKQVLNRNPKAMIGGTLGLLLQGFELRRPVTDIDIFIPYGETINTDFLQPYTRPKKEEAVESTPVAACASDEKKKPHRKLGRSIDDDDDDDDDDFEETNAKGLLKEEKDNYGSVEGMSCKRFINEQGTIIDFFQPDNADDYIFLPDIKEGLRIAPKFFLFGVKARVCFDLYYNQRTKHTLDLLFMLGQSLGAHT